MGIKCWSGSFFAPEASEAMRGSLGEAQQGATELHPELPIIMGQEVMMAWSPQQSLSAC